MKESPVVRYVAMNTVPFIQLFAVYVLAHGEDGPGGGFQGGVIFAASYVLMALVKNWKYGRAQFRQAIADALVPAGAMLYAGIGIVCLLVGGAFLQYDAFVDVADAHAVELAHHLGLIGIELGVMITVTASMVTLFFEMSSVSEEDDPTETGEFTLDRQEEHGSA